MKTEKNLTGKICVITGGSGLLGRAFSNACVLRGAQVVLLDIKKESGSMGSKKNTTFINCDVTNTEEVSKTIELLSR